MVRRTRNRLKGRRNTTPWSYQQRIDLLARLDLFIEENNPDDKEHILRSLLSHFKEYHNKELDGTKQIRARLMTEWNKFRDPKSNHKFEDFFQLGSSVLQRLDEKTKYEILRRKAVIRSGTNRELRSANRNLRIETNRDKREHIGPDDSPLKRKRQRQRQNSRKTPSTPQSSFRQPTTPLRRTPRLMTPALATRQRITPQYTTPRLTTPRVRVSQSVEDDSSLTEKSIKEDPSSFRSTTVESSSPSVSPFKIPPVTAIQEVKNNPSESEIVQSYAEVNRIDTRDSCDNSDLSDCTSITSIHQSTWELTPQPIPQPDPQPTPQPDLQRNLQRNPIIQVTAETPRIDYDDPDLIQQILGTLTQGNVHEILSSILSDNIYYRKRCLELQNEREETATKKSILNTLLNSAKSINLDIAIVQEAQERNSEIAGLRRRLALNVVYQRFSESDVFKNEEQNQKAAKGYIIILKRALNSLSKKKVYQKFPPGLLPTKGTDLDILKRNFIINPPENVSPGMSVQSLTGFVVCEWVLLEKLHCFAMLENLLLESYRNHIFARLGKDILRAFDFAAHQSVFESDYFKVEFLRRTATRLTERLLRILNPMIIDGGYDIVRKCLMDVFEAALHLKTLGIIGQAMYKIVWPAIDSDYDSYTMQKSIPEFPAGNFNTSNDMLKRVIMPLVPGLLICKYERDMVDYGGFTMATDEIPETRRLTILAHAIVIA